jgi:hypothetical protein
MLVASYTYCMHAKEQTRLTWNKQDCLIYVLHACIYAYIYKIEIHVQTKHTSLHFVFSHKKNKVVECTDYLPLFCGPIERALGTSLLMTFFSASFASHRSSDHLFSLCICWSSIIVTSLLTGGNLARGAPTKKGRSTSGHCVLSVIGSISLP